MSMPTIQWLWINQICDDVASMTFVMASCFTFYVISVIDIETNSVATLSDMFTSKVSQTNNVDG